MKKALLAALLLAPLFAFVIVDNFATHGILYGVQTIWYERLAEALDYPMKLVVGAEVVLVAVALVSIGLRRTYRMCK